MSTQSNKELITRYLAALSGNEKPGNIVDRYVTDQSLKEHIAYFEDAFPKYKLLLDDMVAEGDRVALRTTFRGVHKGEFQGIRATGKEVSISVMLIYRIEGDKIAEHWMNADALSLLQQLGAVPVPA